MKIGRLNTIKNEIVNKMADSQDLLKLLYYSDCEDDVYAKDDLTDDIRMKIMRENIYTVKRIPMYKSNEMKTYLSLAYARTVPTQRNGKFYKECMIGITVITSQELDNIPQGSRLDEIDDVISDIFEGENVKSFMDCRISSSEELNCPDPYVGKLIVLRFVDTIEKAIR